MSLSCYHAAPCIGHLDHARRICGYLRKFPHSVVWFCICITSHAEQANKIQEYYWFSQYMGMLLKLFHQISLFQRKNMFFLLLLFGLIWSMTLVPVVLLPETCISWIRNLLIGLESIKNCWDCNIWFWVRCCLFWHWSSYWPKFYFVCFWYSNIWTYRDVWRQWKCRILCWRSL